MKQALKWEFPGGKIEAQETAEQCLLREIKEELNIEIEIVRQLEAHVYDYGNFCIQLIPFVCKYLSGDILLAEHMDYRWLLKAELPTLDWAPADVAVVEMLLAQG
jgi:8-oxo-dGTP diphosphatase